MSKKLYQIFSGVMILVVVSKGLGFVRESMIAARYGAGFVSDVYTFEDGLINAIYTVCAGVVSTTFIPKALTMDLTERNRFTVNYMNILMLIMLTVTSLMIIFARTVLRLIVPGFFEIYNQELMEHLIFVTRINFLSLIFVYLENFLMVILQANNYFLFSSIQGIILNSALILYLSLFYQYEIVGIIAVKLLAHMGNIFILYVFVSKKKLVRFFPYLNVKAREIQEVFKLAVPVLVVNIVSQMNYIIDRSMASSLDSGSMALLSYANTLASLLYSVIGASLCSIAYTQLSQKQESRNEVQQLFKKYQHILLGIVLPCCIVMSINAQEICSIAFERGKISGRDIAVIAKILILYIPSNLALCIRDLYNRLLYINKKTSIPSGINLAGLILNIVLNIVFTKVWGIYGLAFATSVVSVLTVTATVVYCKRFGLFIQKRALRKLVGRLFVSIALCIIVHSIVQVRTVFLNAIVIMVTTLIAFVIFNYSEIKQWRKEVC